MVMTTKDKAQEAATPLASVINYTGAATQKALLFHSKY